MRWLMLSLVVLGGCTTKEDDTLRATTSLGFIDVKVGGLSFWSCSKDDYTGREFTATNPQGKVVSGVVCCGAFKGCTVRF